MKTRMARWSAVALLLGTIWAGAAAGQQKNTQDPGVQFKAALLKEVADGDLKGAIELYKKVADGKNHALAAQALMRMGKAYETLGDSAEAQETYERIASKFLDQKEAAEARTRLAALFPATGFIKSRELTLPDTVGLNSHVSSDGRYVLGIGSGGVRDRDHLIDLATGSFRRLRELDPFLNNGVLFWGSLSRGGKYLAYSGRGPSLKRELRVMNLQGDPKPGKLFDLATHPDMDYIDPLDWTSDNKSIVIEVRQKDKTWQIGLVSVADGSFRLLKSMDWREADHAFLSPDDKYLAFDTRGADVDQQRDIFILALDGSRYEDVVEKPSNDVVMGWSPDGRYLLYASENTPGSVSLQALPFADGKAQEPAKAISKSDIGLAASLGVTSSGALYLRETKPHLAPKAIRFATFDWNTEQLTTATAISDEIDGYSPHWSPDGSQFAYSSYKEGLGDTYQSLIVRSTESGKFVREVHPQLEDFSGSDVSWSADGHSFVIQGWDFKGRLGIYRIDAETGGASQLVGFADNEYGVLSPDQKYVYLRRQKNGTATLFKRDIASGQEQELYQGNFELQMLSPDGRYIAISIINNGGGNGLSPTLISLIPVDGGPARQLARGALMAWAPDSRSLLLDAGGQGGNAPSGQVVRVSLDSQSHAVSTFDGTPWQLGDVQMNGRQIAFTTTTEPDTNRQTTTVRVLENVLSTLKAPEQPQTTRQTTTFTGTTGQLVWVDRAGKVEKIGSPMSYNNGAPRGLSPDGKRVAVSLPAGTGRDIWVIELSSGKASRLTYGGDSGKLNDCPNWSYDGRIAFVEQKTNRMYAMRVNSSAPVELLLESTTPRLACALSWSPDNKLIAYPAFDPKTGRDLWAISVNGDRKPVTILQTLSEEAGEQISPDGRWIAYCSNQTGRWEVYIRAFPGGSEEWRVSTEGGLSPKWRADSKELYFLNYPVTPRRLMGSEISVTGSSVQISPPREVVHDAFDVVDFSPGPDGKRFLMVAPADPPAGKSAAGAKSGLTPNTPAKH